MVKLFSFGLNILADIFYPKYCFSCKRAGSYLCKFCILQVPKLAQSFCVVCGKLTKRGFTHNRCKSKLTPDRLLCALPYKHPTVSEMIIAGKYYFIPEVFSILGELGAQILTDELQNISQAIVCPIPLHKQRKKWRGFNQSEIAGKILAQSFKIPMANLLIRSKNTKTQKDLASHERKLNISNAFACSKAWEGNLPTTVLLIDDVTTTGHTFLEASRALKQNGVEIVWCISLAKD